MDGRRPTALVTGASHGFGAAIAKALVEDGFDVAITATKLENLAQTLDALSSRGAKIVPVALDLRSLQSGEDAMATAIAAFGALDFLINNAAMALGGPITETTRRDWDAVMQTNLTGPYFLSQSMGRHLIATGRPGGIVNLSSTHGLVALSGRSMYGISKAAIIHMTKMMAIEWAEHGIRVNAVAPGAAETHTRAAFLADPAIRKSVLSRIPLGRFAAEEEVAAAVSYLVSPRAAYMTGQTLVLDGGLSVT